MTYQKPHRQSSTISSSPSKSMGPLRPTTAMKRSLPYSPMRIRKRERLEVRQNVQQKAIKADNAIHEGNHHPLNQTVTGATSLPTNLMVNEGESSIAVCGSVDEQTSTNEYSTGAATASAKTLNGYKTAASIAAPKDIYQPALIFPYSNDPHLRRQKKRNNASCVAENHKQWETLFNSQYSFGSFVHGIPKPKPTHEYFYKGQWPLAQEDLLGISPNSSTSISSRATSGKQVQKGSDSNRTLEPSSSSSVISSRASASKDGNKRNNTANVLFSPVPEPQLPDMKLLRHQMNNINRANSRYNKQQQNSSSQSCLLTKKASDEGVTYYDASELTSVEEEQLWRERLDLLKQLQQNGFHEKWNITEYNPYQNTSKATRLQRQLKAQALKLKQHATTMTAATTILAGDNGLHPSSSSTANTSLHDPNSQSINYSSSSMIQQSLSTNNSSTSTITLDDQWENISFTCPADKERTINAQYTSGPNRPRTRISFLLFALGFICPPIWIIGALYTPSPSTSTSSTAAIVIMAEKTTTVQDYDRKIDYRWRRYSKNAFLLFLLLLTAVLVLMLVSNPGSMGYRKSSNDQEGYERRRVHADGDNAANDTFQH